MDNGANVDPWVLWIRELGSNGWAMFFWAVVGVFSAMMTMPFVVGKKDRYGCMIIAAVVVFILYAMVWRHNVREKNFMRQRRGWLQTAIFNTLVNGLTILISALHLFITNPENPKWIPFWILVTIFVFALEELTRPVFDFGVLTFIYRLPLQFTLAIFGRQFSPYYLIGAFLMLFCAIWQPYYTAEFVRRLEEQNINGGGAANLEAGQAANIDLQRRR